MCIYIYIYIYYKGFPHPPEPVRGGLGDMMGGALGGLVAGAPGVLLSLLLLPL